jgi:hypothetical protein
MNNALLVSAAVVLTIWTAPAHGQPPVPGQPVDCSDGIKYDDALFESGTGFQSFALPLAADVMKFNPPFAISKLQSVCICWLRNASNNDNQIFFDIGVWASDGPNGAPGTLLGKLTTQTATGVPFSSASTFYRYDLSSLNLTTTAPIYIGPAWDPGDDKDFFVCEDTSIATPRQPGYYGDFLYVDKPDILMGETGHFPEYRALGIRSVFSEATANCIPDSNTLCLNNGRFKVKATYDTGSQSGAAHVVKLTDETGYLWFFNSTNVEAVIKVLNACSLNQRYWVFSAGLTNVGVEITVTDTSNNTTKHYSNPRNRTYVTNTDTDAFATCP